MDNSKPLPKQISPELAEEIKEKLEKIKKTAEKFKDKALKEYKKDIIGITILPPEKPKKNLTKEQEEKLKNQISILVLLNDLTSEKVPNYKLKDSLTRPLIKMGKAVDENIVLEIMLTSELREDCYDCKYEILHLIGLSVPLYDPADMIGALRVSELHKTMVLKKFEKYIVSYVAAGSVFRGEKSNDIDVFLIIDDTDVKKMSRVELKDKLRAIIIGMGFEASAITGVKKQFHIQVYILTDFWESVKDAHPVIFTLLRDGVPLYDRGVFMPWKLLLKMGRIKPSPESIDMHMSMGEKLIKAAKRRLLDIVSLDMYYAALNPAQAALMLYGVNPPTPKESIKLLDEIFVKKEKLLEKKYVKILQDLFDFFKGMEHGKIKEVSGKEIDRVLKDTEDYLKRIKKLFYQIDKKREKQSLTEIHNTCFKIAKDAFNSKSKDFYKAFKKYCDQENLPEKIFVILKEIEKAKEDYKSKKITSAEIEKVRREARTFIRVMVDHIQRKKHYELDKATVKFKYGGNYGSVLMLDNKAFIIADAKEGGRDIQKAKIDKNGNITDVKKATLEEYEDAISKAKVPGRIFIKEKFFENLKNLFGKDVEVML